MEDMIPLHRGLLHFHQIRPMHTILTCIRQCILNKSLWDLILRHGGYLLLLPLRMPRFRTGYHLRVHHTLSPPQRCQHPHVGHQQPGPP
jgi:hypothetical protein